MAPPTKTPTSEHQDELARLRADNLRLQADVAHARYQAQQAFANLGRLMTFVHMLDPQLVERFLRWERNAETTGDLQARAAAARRL